MSKKVSRKKLPPRKRKGWSKRQGLIAIAVMMSLSLAGLILAQWRGGHFLSRSLPLQPQATPQLSKEYIYAGGRLLATEEPGGTSPLSAPAALIATGTSSPQVNLSWAASTGGTVSHYQVERCQLLAPNCYTVVAPNVPASTTTYNDTTVSAGAAYLYRVRAVDTLGNFSTYSTVDLATAISFADDPLNPSGTRTPIRAQHVTQLRQAINAVRALANLPAAGWTNTVQAGAVVRAVDVQELRSNLDQARSTLGLAAAAYSDQPLGVGNTLIKKTHIEELRLAVK
jgi:hypothetical protein